MVQLRGWWELGTEAEDDKQSISSLRRSCARAALLCASARRLWMMVAMGGEAASSPARSPKELAPLPGSPSGSPSAKAREALRRALNGDNEQPNLALAPLRWNIEKERRARGAAHL